jgi:type I restriction enzyme S subunit
MEEWKEYKLKEICLKITDGSHSSPESVPLGYPMFSVKDMLENRFDYTRCKHISKDDFLKLKKGDCVPQKGDVLVAKDGSFLKQIFVCKETKEECILSSIAIFRPNRDIIYPDFLSYLLKSPKVYNYIANNCVSGSALPRIILKDFKEINITIPSINIQKKILNFLLPIDDKIELNRRINENLEQQAQALFKSWFVDFEPFKDGKFVDSELGMIPEGWKVGTLSDIANVTMGQSPKGTSYNENGEGIVFYQGRADFGNRYPSVRLFTTEPTRYADPFSVLLSVRAPVGDINIAVEKCCIGRGLASIYSKTGHQSFVLYTMFSLKKELDKFNSEGTVFGSINRTSIENLRIIIPSIDVIQQFDTLVRSFDIKLFDLFKETENLKKIRDTLLPKLMSGELKLSEIDTNLNDHIND